MKKKIIMGAAMAALAVKMVGERIAFAVIEHTAMPEPVTPAEMSDLLAQHIAAYRLELATRGCPADEIERLVEITFHAQLERAAANEFALSPWGQA